MKCTTDPQPRPVLDYPSAQPSRALPPGVQLMLSPPKWSILLALLGLLALIWTGRHPGHYGELHILSLLFLLFGVSGYWLLRFSVMLILAAVYRINAQRIAVHWKRWTMAPLIVIFSMITLTTDWPAKLTFALHRPRMEQLAEQFLSGDRPLPVGGHRIGLYDFDQIKIYENNRVSFRATVGSWGYAFTYRRHATDGNFHARWNAYSWD